MRLGLHVLWNPFVMQPRWGIYTKRYSIVSVPVGPKTTASSRNEAP